MEITYQGILLETRKYPHPTPDTDNARVKVSVPQSKEEGEKIHLVDYAHFR